MLEVRLPGLLRDSVGGEHPLWVEGETLEEAMQTLFGRYPLLRAHLYDEQGELRPHVLLFYNNRNLAQLERRDLPLELGDQLIVLQAVSGG